MPSWLARGVGFGHGRLGSRGSVLHEQRRGERAPGLRSTRTADRVRARPAGARPDRVRRAAQDQGATRNARDRAPRSRPRSKPRSARSRLCTASPARWRRGCKTSPRSSRRSTAAMRRGSGARRPTPTTSRSASPALPGFGEMKIKALSAVLWKRFGVQAAEGLDAVASDARRRRLPREARLVPGEEARAQGQDARASELRPRPPVTAYVTREHPETGFDELLVFDFPGEPGVQRRRARRRNRGGRDRRCRPPSERSWKRPESRRSSSASSASARTRSGHYVQLKPTRLLPESWEHIREDGPVHCRWIPVSAEAEVWGLRGDFISALVRKRAVGYVTRGRELLVFEHAGPDAGPCRPRRSRRDARGGSRARDQGRDGRRR